MQIQYGQLSATAWAEKMPEKLPAILRLMQQIDTLKIT